jgi:hypothetical protein
VILEPLLTTSAASKQLLEKKKKTVKPGRNQRPLIGPQAFDSEQQLMRHVTSEHFDGSHMLAEPFNPFEPLVDVATDTFYCPSCQAAFDSAAGVQRHQAMCKGAALAAADDFLHPCEVRTCRPERPRNRRGLRKHGEHVWLLGRAEMVLGGKCTKEDPKL